MSRRAALPVIAPGPSMIRASCYCGAESVSLPVRASHAEESAAIRAAVAACKHCGTISMVEAAQAGAVELLRLDQCKTISLIDVHGIGLNISQSLIANNLWIGVNLDEYGPVELDEAGVRRVVDVLNHWLETRSLQKGEVK